ncbi:MAG: GDP-mannose 4,6-dehydratase, partial [Acidobacteriota bacterium]
RLVDAYRKLRNTFRYMLEEMTEAAFAEFDLDWRDHVDVDRSLFRASEIQCSRGNPEKSRRLLGWEAKVRFGELVGILAANERKRPHLPDPIGESH